VVQQGMGFQQFEIDEAIGVGLEDNLAGIAALRDVVRHTRRDDARKTSHTTKVRGLGAGSRKRSGGPRPSVPACCKVGQAVSPAC
jgi:hypothetical protein